MTPAGTRRVATVSALLLGLAGLAHVGWLPAPWLPATARGLLALHGALATFLLLGLALPLAGSPRESLARVVAVGLVMLPGLAFAAFGATGPAGTALPNAGLWLCLGASLALATQPERTRRLGAAALLTVLGLDVLLGASLEPGRGAFLPPSLQPFGSTVLWLPGPATAADEVQVVPGPRPGAFVRRNGSAPGPSAPAAGPWPSWRVATTGPLPRAGPVVRVWDDVSAQETQRLPLEGGGMATLVRDGPEPATPWDLSAFDVLVLGERAPAWDALDAGRAERWAEAVAGWVRRGGVLLGPALEVPWPAPLARALGSAARVETMGLSGAHRLGLGQVLRAHGRSQALRLLSESSLWPPLGTAFDGLAEAPPLPQGFASWADQPSSRWRGGVIALAFALAVVLLEGSFKRWVGVVARLGPVALAGAAVLILTHPGEAQARAEGLVLDLGGPGGRRVEAVWFSAGPGGYLGQLTWGGEGAVRWLGSSGSSLSNDGLLRLGAGASGWLVRQGDARGLDGEDQEDRSAGHLRSYLRGTVEAARLRFGRVRALPLRAPGLPPIAALSLTLR